MSTNRKPIVYVDMDDTICDYSTPHSKMLSENPWNKYPQSVYDFYRKLKPIEGAIESVKSLTDKYDVWILTRPSYLNPSCYTEKRLWVEDHLGLDWCEKLIICTDKSLMKGDYLIDDILCPDFEGKQIQFGTNEFPNWSSVIKEIL